MKFTTSLASALVLIAASAMPYSLTAQEAQQKSKTKYSRYHLIDLGTFGGPASYINIPDGYAAVLNNRGIVAGSADTSMADPYPNFCFNPDCFVSRAFEADGAHLTDLGILPGGASSGANWITPSGLIAGVSENGRIDPLIPGFPELRAVIWDHGKIVDLGALADGYESAANSANNRGQVVGIAMNKIADPFSMTGLGYQTRAFFWQNGRMKDLGTLGGTDAQAIAINELGQVIGESYIGSDPSPYCAINLNLPLSTGAFLWQKGKIENLGSFGGTCTFASALNNRGQAVGFSTLPGDSAQHPFLWEQGVLTDLGTLGGRRGNGISINDTGETVGWADSADGVPHASIWKDGAINDLGTVADDSFSFAYTVNARGQVAGISTSSDFTKVRAFLWQESGPIVDLNSLIPASSSLYLTTPETINDRGEIAGQGLDFNGNEHAFLLVPCRNNDKNCNEAASDGATNRISPMPVMQASPDSVAHLQRRLGLGHMLTSLKVGATDPPSTAFAGTGTSVEPAPTNLTSGVIRRGWHEAVVLGWKDNSTNEDSFHIERCTGSTCTNFAEIATTGPNTIRYFNAVTLGLHLTFRYRVRAHGPSGYSAYSNIRTAGTF